MAIFDKELINNFSDRENPLPKFEIQSPNSIEINTNMGGFNNYGQTGGPSKRGLTIKELSGIHPGNNFTVDSPFQMIPKSELLDNQRYSLYKRDLDLEDIYGQQQSWMSSLANGVIKMGATAIGTFAQSFATIPNTISGIKNGSIKDIAGDPNGWEGSIDNWTKNMEDYFPNYITKKEKEHPFLAAIPGFAGSANFWGNSIIKNLGFTAGAIGGAIAQDAVIGAITGGIGDIPIVASQIGKASLWLNKLFTGTNRIDNVLELASALGKTEKQILNITRLGELAAADRAMNGVRYGMNIYGSARTEAGIEARDGYRQVKEELMNQYKIEHLGVDPTPEDLQQIDSYAEDAMNTRFGINMALLTVSNAIQFDNLFKSFTTASKGFSGGFTKSVEDLGKIGLKKGSLDEFERKTVTGIGNKAWDIIKPRIPNIFVEGVYEEGGQYAAERGTYDYYTRKYNNLKDPNNKKNWDALNEVVASTNKGLADQFGTSAGIENMFVGAISALISGGIMGKIDKIKGQGKDARLQSAINSLNQYGLTGILNDKYTDTLRSSAIAKEMEEAAKSGNIYKYKNLKSDMFFSFVASRIPSGMHDVTIEQLNMLKDISKEDFEKTFGMDFNSSNKKTVVDYVDSLIGRANNIKQTVDSLDATFKNPYRNIVNPTTNEEAMEASSFHTFNNWKTDLAYYASVAPEMNDRLSSIQQSASKVNPLITNDLLGNLTKKESLKDLSDIYEEKANQLSKTITEYTTPEDKRKIKAQVKALRTASEKINLAINNKDLSLKTFEDTLNFELNNREAGGEKQVSSERIAELATYGIDINKITGLKKDASDIFDQLSSEAGFNKYFKQAEDIASEKTPEPKIPTEEEKAATPIVETPKPAYEFVNKTGAKESPEVEREYELPTAKTAKVRKMAEDRFKVTAPNGDVTFHSTREKAKEAADEMNADMADLAKVKILALNDDGTVKVEDLAGNIQNISPEAMAGYEKIQSEQEKLAKDKEQLDKQQKEIENNSGDVATGNPIEDIKTVDTTEKESKKRDAKTLFVSGITESEDWSDTTQSSPHIKRSREFLNKVGYMSNRANLRTILLTPKQIDGLNLTGLVQLSYGLDVTAKIDSIPGVNDPELGLVAQIFTEQVGDKLFYVDKNGARLTEVGQPVDLQEIIFQTMPTTSLFYNAKDKQGNPIPRYRSNQKEEAEAYSRAWGKVRKQMFEDDANQYSVYKFSVSRGIANLETVNGQRAKNHVGGILINEKKISSTEGLVVVPTRGVVIDNNGNSINFPNGRPVIKAGDNIEFLQNAQINSNQADTVYNILKTLGDDVMKQSKAGKPIELNSAYTSYLQHLLYWKSDAKTSPNRIFINTDAMTFVLGDKSFDLTKVAESEKDIKEQLGKAYHSVNNKTLEKNFNAKFYEYYMDKDGKLAEREWKNYQTYLLAAKNPDGTARSGEATPLTTGIAKPTDAMPYTHKQKYATLELQLAVEKAPAPVVAKAAPIAKIGDYTLGQENTITLKEPIGDVKFTPTIVDGTVNVEATSSDKIKALAADPEKSAPYINYLKENNQFDAAKTTEENLVTFISLNISGRLQSMLPKEAPEDIYETFSEEAEKSKQESIDEEQKRAEAAQQAPVSDIEAKRADIERILNEKGVAIINGLEIRRTSDYNRNEIFTVNVPRQGNNFTSYPFNTLDDAITFASNLPKSEKEQGKFASILKAGGKLNYLKQEKDKAIQTVQNFRDNAQIVVNFLGERFESKYQDNRDRSIQKQELINKINARYDAELAALEGGKKATIQMQPANIEKIKAGIKTTTTRSESQAKQINIPVGQSAIVNFGGQDFKVTNRGLLTIKEAGGKEAIIKSEGVKSESEFMYQQTKDWVNGKGKLYIYDIAALEEAKPKGPIEPSNPQGPSDEFRKVGTGEKEMMTDAEFQLFKQWHAENVPNIPYEVLENIITTHDNEKAWGVFENGVAKFLRGGLRGTEYHEIFEGIWAGFLSPEEKAAIMDEFRNNTGTFTDRETGKKIEYSKATDRQLKERIADDFADFRLGKLPARTLGERITRFFRSVLEFLKSFISNPSLKTQLFKAIDTGKFKESKLPESVKTFAPEYRRFGSLTEKQTHEFIQDMTARASGILFKNAQKKLLFTPDGITSNEMFDQIADKYKTELIDTANKITKMQFIGSDKTWEDLKQATRRSLRTLGIEFDEEDRVNINDEKYDNRLYAPEPFTTNWKKSSPGAIKFTIATLLEVAATNQEGSLSMELPKVKTSSIGGYKLANFGRSFATLMDKLANTNKVSKAVDKLINLAEYDAKYVRLFEKLGGNRTNKVIPFDQFDSYDWRLFIEFMQTFTKQKPTALVQYKSGTEVYTQPADIYTAAKTKQVEWINNMRSLAKKKNSAITFNSDKKMYQVDRAKLNALPIRTPQDQLAFLEKIGVIFTLDAYNNLKTDQVKKFADQVAALKTYFGESGDVYSVTSKTLKINGPTAILAGLFVKVNNPNQDSTRPNVEGERVNNFSDNNTPSLFENDFNENETIDDLKRERTELNDVFSTHSQVLKKGGLFYDEDGNKIQDIKVMVIEGTLDEDKNKGTKTSKLTLANRFVQEINQNLKGNYYILMPGDASTEFMMNLGNNIEFGDIQSGRAWNKTYTIFKGYLMDDIALAMDSKNRSKNVNVAPRATELRFFNDILSDVKEGKLVPSEVLKKINNMIASGDSMDDINVYIKENTEKINEYIKNYINEIAEETRSILKDNGKILQVSENVFAYQELDDAFAKDNSISKFRMSNDMINNVLTFNRINYVISNIEYHKILFGDPLQFSTEKGKLDETKRVKSFLSPRRTTFDHPIFNNHLNGVYNKAGKIELSVDDPGYHEHKPFLNTITLSDVNLKTSLMGKVNEADAASWMMDGAYREVKLKNHQWSDEAEVWHQWQMAYTRQNMPGYKYTNEALKKQDIETISKPAPKYTIEVLKPIVSGNKFNKNQFDLVLDKFSQMPIYYSMVEGTNMEKLYAKMFDEQIDYAIMESGRKVGSEGTYSLYNEEGDLNTEPFNNLVQVPFKIYGIQVENSFEGAKSQTRGSQLTKLASMDLFENGEAINETAKKEYERNVDILNKMHINAYKDLLNKLGIIDNEDGTFTFKNPKAVSQTLMTELLRRELSDNAIDSVQLDENNQFPIPFEASPSYIQIRNVLYSMVDKAIVSPKVNGSSNVQVPVTLFENIDGGINKEKGNQALRFYEDKDGRRYCEVMLPHWFREKFSNRKYPTDQSILDYLNKTDEGRSILKGIGFRIPTQAMSSIEAFVVKGFLPQYMGNTVVVPSEITTKAGSDFDIDKLNMYLKSVYTDSDGNIRLVKYLGSEEATKEFYGEVFDRKLEKKRLDKDELKEAVDIKAYSLDDPKNLLGKYGDLLDVMLADIDPADYTDYINEQIKTLGDANVQGAFREQFVKDMYKRSLENEYYDSLEKLVTMPENFKALITPVDDSGLKDFAKDMRKLKGIDESKIKNRILNPNFLTTLRNAFVTGKRWVGIVAVNITNHSLAQKVKVYIDTNKIEGLSKADKKILGDGSVALPHNKVTINGESKVSLSGRTTEDGTQLISNRLSGYATSVVDVSKDPYIMDLITSDLVIGTAMFLERIGTGKTGLLFLNQPIVIEYLKLLDNKGVRYLFDEENIILAKSKFANTDKNLIKSVGIDVKNSNLEENISDYSAKKEFSKPKNAEQQNILDEFLKYAKMAEFNFKFTQAMNYDTTKFRSADTLFRKQTRTADALSGNIISSVKEVMDATFIGEQARILDLLSEAMGEVLVLDQSKFTDITERVLKPYAQKEFMSQDDYERIGNKIRSSFLDYIIQTKTGLNNSIKELLVDMGTSVSTRLYEAKEKYPQISILHDFVISSSDRVDGAQTIKLNAKISDAYDENMYTGMMRELRDNPGTNELYKDIVILSILQGTYQSNVSIGNIIPIEDYSSIVSPIISGLTNDADVEAFANGWFQRNNFKDDAIMPQVTPKFFQLNEGVPIAEQVNQFGDHVADIYQYYSPAFPNIDAFEIQSKDRRVLLLSETYNARYLWSDFVKIPRVITDKKTGETIDITNGQTVTKQDFAIRKQKGDNTLNDVFGYKRVRTATGKPLTTTNEKGDTVHVYKLINLYGESPFTSEYYTHPKMSVLNNGTVKMDNEIPDSDLIQYYMGELVASDFEQSSTIAGPGSETKINIYAGTGENAELSNFAIRPFKNRNDIEFNTVEGAFQAAKLEYSSYYHYPDLGGPRESFFSMEQKFQDATGAEAKALGRTIKGLDTKRWDNDSSEIMKELIKASFEQNPEALKTLLATRNAELTHTQDNTKWGKEFPKLLMEVREELRPTEAMTFDELTEFPTERKQEILSSFAAKHKMTEEQAKTYIDEALQKDRQSVIDKLKECY